MKKFWTLLALLAVALNFSSASLWAAEEMKEESAVAVATEEVKADSVDEAAIEGAAVAQEEPSTPVEEKTDVVVAQPADSAVKKEVTAVVEEEKKTEELEAILPETVQTEEKAS